MQRRATPFVRSRFTQLAGKLALSATVLALAGTPTLAQKKYDTGVTDTEIKVGNIMPYSGPASAYGIIGKTMSAYFRMINDNGGVNGRKINFITYDDAYSPPKTVEQARKLVESDEVFLIFASLGTAPNAAIQKYMNNMKVPQIFVATGASRWGDPEHFPWTIGWQPNYRAEAPGLCHLHPAAPSDREARRALPERRFRQGLCARAEGRLARKIRQDGRERDVLRDRDADGRIRRSWRSRPPTPTSSSTSPPRNSRRRRSRRSPSSAGIRSIS